MIFKKDYMEKVIECLQNETNGVLESPTGTGKTLSLLCSSLAWLQLKKAQLQLQQQTMDFDQDNEYVTSLKADHEQIAGKTSGRSFLGLPTIFYASRTHSQLSQAMSELKRSAYSNMKACALGSRDMMCINPELATEKDSTVKVGNAVACIGNLQSKRVVHHCDQDDVGMQFQT
ncbi:hypothetical protein NQ317_003492 [Molorchus minor]|uniref:Helicase ATP-binding domain-containing protein n=1 Tax=Molorchus minor TaxID=1323400 RepID=A0ABQ9J193_9CUCU|nr:hypothetical protein NQ317_003492 [Molorchus minor]